MSRKHALPTAVLATAGVGGPLEIEARRILLAHCMAHPTAALAAAAWSISTRSFSRILNVHGTNWQRSIIDLRERATKRAA